MYRMDSLADRCRRAASLHSEVRDLLLEVAAIFERNPEVVHHPDRDYHDQHQRVEE